VTSTAVAGQVPIASLSRGVAPYTAASTNTTGPYFGFIVGNSYTIHLPTYNSNRQGYSPGDPSKCFNSSPCSGDPDASLVAVVAPYNIGSLGPGAGGSTGASSVRLLE
jgi:hypothetical protein